MKSGGQVKVVWEEEEQTLTLEGEPVLTYKLAWPQVEGGGAGGTVDQPFLHPSGGQLAQGGGGGEVYWSACLELVRRREESRPFSPWRGELSGGGDPVPGRSAQPALYRGGGPGRQAEPGALGGHLAGP